MRPQKSALKVWVRAGITPTPALPHQGGGGFRFDLAAGGLICLIAGKPKSSKASSAVLLR